MTPSPASITSSASASQVVSSSQTQTGSRTRSQSQTGFPQQRVIDNTGVSTNFIDSMAVRAVSPSLVRGVLVYWHEGDLVCGPGAYRLTLLNIPLASPSVTATSLAVSLYVSDASATVVSAVASSIFSPTIGSTPSFMQVRHKGVFGLILWYNLHPLPCPRSSTSQLPSHRRPSCRSTTF